MNRILLLLRAALAVFPMLAPLTAAAQSDAFAAATPLTTFPTTGSNIGATKETGEANHGNNPGGASVWWSWTPAETGYFRVSLLGSDFDTEMGIYTGASVGTTVLLTQNDDNGAGATEVEQLTSAAVVYVRAGETILIAVDGYNNNTTTETGNIVINIAPLPAGEVPPANDLFAAAAVLPPVTSGGAVVSNRFGTREVGEPVLGGMPGGTSVWWSWVAPVTEDMEFRLSGATTAATPAAFNTGIAVYTGTSLDTLVPVTSAGPALSNAVQFNAAAGVTYYITADVASTTFQQSTGNLTLSYSLSPLRIILPANAAWEWLHPQGGTDPAGADPDFNTTWYKPAAYNGPDFNAASGALLGYGVIDSAPIVTNISDPGTGLRYSAYFRRQFTLTESSPLVEALILADDGAFIYLDGVLVRTVNMPAGAVDTYTQLAQGTSSEAGPTRVGIGLVSAGQHEIAVSVHNAAVDSSDLGFSLALIIDRTPPATLTPAGIGTGFEEPVIGSTSYVRSSNGTVEFGWTALGGLVQSAASHPAGQGVAPTGKFFRLNSARTNPFLSDRISLAQLDAAQKASIIASAKVRTFTTSTTTFEAEDDLTISLQSSTDGSAFTTAAEILPRTAGGTPDNLIAISQATGDYATFTTAPGAVPLDAVWLRFQISGGNNSTSEYIYIDDLKLEIGAVNPLADDDGDGQTNISEDFAGTNAADPLSVLRISSLTPETGNDFTLTFAAVSGKFYRIEYSDSLTGTWTILRDDVFTAVSGPLTESGLTLPAGPRGFVRVRVKP